MKLQQTALAIAVAAMAGAAVAQPTITFTLLEARWSNAQGGNGISYLPDSDAPSTAGDFVTYPGEAVVRWGLLGNTGTGDQQSGYRFAPENTDLVVDPEGLPPGVTPTVFGTFTHENFPINRGTGISAVTLDLLGTVEYTPDTAGFDSVNALAPVDVVFSYLFSHTETPNRDTPEECENQEPGDLNDPPCADIVTVTSEPTTDEAVFNVGTIDGQAVTDTVELVYSAFSQNQDFSTSFDPFFSQEGQENSAFVGFNFTVARQVEPAPIPAPLALLSAGLLGLAWARRRT